MPRALCVLHKLSAFARGTGRIYEGRQPAQARGQRCKTRMAVTAHLLSALGACRSLLGRLGFWGCCTELPVRCNITARILYRPHRDFLQLLAFCSKLSAMLVDILPEITKPRLRTSTVLQCQSAVVYRTTGNTVQAKCPLTNKRNHAAMQWHAAVSNKTLQHTVSLVSSTSEPGACKGQATQLRAGARLRAPPHGSPSAASLQLTWLLHPWSARYAGRQPSQHASPPGPVPAGTPHAQPRAYAAFTAAVCNGVALLSAVRALESYSSRPTRHRYRPVNISSSACRQLWPSICARTASCEQPLS